MRYVRKVWDRIQRIRLSSTEYARWKGVTVGNGCRVINPAPNWGSEPFLIEIGDRVTIAPSVAFVTHDGATWLLRDGEERKQRYARISIGSDVFIGLGSIIMPGVQIGDRVIVGAGSVVTKSIPSNSVIAGNPAKFVCTFDKYSSRDYRSTEEMRGNLFRERVLSIVEPGFKPNLRID